MYIYYEITRLAGILHKLVKVKLVEWYEPLDGHIVSVYLGVHGDLIQKGNGGLRKLRDHPPPIGSESYVEDFLYDNDTDPNQLVNLVCKPELADIRKMLGTML